MVRAAADRLRAGVVVGAEVGAEVDRRRLNKRTAFMANDPWEGR
jgi:hypothetical protein